MTQTITNPSNPSETYTYGKKGRKPKWVTLLENTNGKPTPEPTTTPTTPITLTIVLENDTLVNKTESKTYTFGKCKGKRPSWVKDWMQENPSLVPVKSDLIPTGRPKNDDSDEDDSNLLDLPRTVKPTSDIPEADTYQWHFKSEMNNNAIVVARNDLEAVGFLNLCFKIPYNKYTLDFFWKKASHTCGLAQGVWRLKKDDTEWSRYPTLKERETVSA